MTLKNAKVLSIEPDRIQVGGVSTTRQGKRSYGIIAEFLDEAVAGRAVELLKVGDEISVDLEPAQSARSTAMIVTNFSPSA